MGVPFHPIYHWFFGAHLVPQKKPGTFRYNQMRQPCHRMLGRTQHLTSHRTEKPSGWTGNLDLLKITWLQFPILDYYSQWRNSWFPEKGGIGDISSPRQGLQVVYKWYILINLFNDPMVFVSSRCIKSINLNQYHANVTIIFVQWFLTSRLYGNKHLKIDPRCSECMDYLPTLFWWKMAILTTSNGLGNISILHLGYI